MSVSKQEKLTALFKSARVVPVLTINRLEDAVPLARALVSGGVRMLEVTLRTPVAIEAAKAMIANVPDAIVGIGTILNADDLARAEELGAKFGISPGATPELLKGAGRSVPACAVLPDRRYRRDQRAHVAGRAQCGRGRRLLAVPGRGHQVRQLVGHNRHVRAVGQVGESGVKSGCRWARTKLSQISGRTP